MTLLDKLKEDKEKVVEGIREKGVKGTLKKNIIKPPVKNIKEMEVSDIPLRKLQGKLEEIDYPTDREFIEENIGEPSTSGKGIGIGGLLTLGSGKAMATAFKLAGYEFESLGSLVSSLPGLVSIAGSILLGIGIVEYTYRKMGEHFPSLSSVYLKEEFRPEITEKDLEW